MPIAISLAINIADFACREPSPTRARAAGPLEPDRWGSPQRHARGGVVHRVAPHAPFARWPRLPEFNSLTIKEADAVNGYEPVLTRSLVGACPSVDRW